MRVWLLPIEPFGERYTADWIRWWPADLQSAGLDVQPLVLGGSPDEWQERRAGEWLDPTATWQWKGAQVAALASVWNEIRDGDVILSLDAWGPATTAALYMRATTGKRVKVAGFWHAGCWDPHDYLSRVGMAPWGLDVERGWARGCDLLLVGSEWAANLVRSHLCASPRIAVVGCPVKAGELTSYAKPWEQRDRLVLFPHRLAPEKGLREWQLIESQYRSSYPDENVQFMRTRDHYTDKRSLYEMLGRARVVVSCAKQETFGIVMQEGVALGAHPLSPRRLSYPEVQRGQGALYESISEAVDQLHQLVNMDHQAGWDGWHEDAIFRAADALRSL